MRLAIYYSAIARYRSEISGHRKKLIDDEFSTGQKIWGNPPRGDKKEDSFSEANEIFAADFIGALKDTNLRLPIRILPMPKDSERKKTKYSAYGMHEQLIEYRNKKDENSIMQMLWHFWAGEFYGSRDALAWSWESMINSLNLYSHPEGYQAPGSLRECLEGACRQGGLALEDTPIIFFFEGGASPARVQPYVALIEAAMGETRLPWGIVIETEYPEEWQKPAKASEELFSSEGLAAAVKVFLSEAYQSQQEKRIKVDQKRWNYLYKLIENHWDLVQWNKVESLCNAVNEAVAILTCPEGRKQKQMKLLSPPQAEQFLSVLQTCLERITCLGTRGDYATFLRLETSESPPRPLTILPLLEDITSLPGCGWFRRSTPLRRDLWLCEHWVEKCLRPNASREDDSLCWYQDLTLSFERPQGIDEMDRVALIRCWVNDFLSKKEVSADDKGVCFVMLDLIGRFGAGVYSWVDKAVGIEALCELIEQHSDLEFVSELVGGREEFHVGLIKRSCSGENPGLIDFLGTNGRYGNYDYLGRIHELLSKRLMKLSKTTDRERFKILTRLIPFLNEPGMVNVRDLRVSFYENALQTLKDTLSEGPSEAGLY